MISDRLNSLRKVMLENGIDYYMIPTSDFHSSEYVSDFFKCREYMSGFTGSSGTLVVSKDEAGLWTDGRYFIQAEDQLKGSTINLFKSGNEGVPFIKDFLQQENCSKFGGNGITVGFDGRVMDVAYVTEIEKTVENIKIVSDMDLVGRIWKERPDFPSGQIYILEEEYTGCSSADKLAEIGRICREKDCEYHMISSLDDIAWILNLRGSDIANNPVFMSYLFLSEEESLLFCNISCIDDKTEKYLEDLGVKIKAYDSVFDYCENLDSGKNIKILLDPDTVNYRLYSTFKDKFEIVPAANPSGNMKAQKNDKELENIRKANITDGVAMVKFLRFLDGYKNDIDGPKITELDVAEKLLNFRRESDEFKDISFETIAAYGAHGAIVHYEPDEKSNIPVERKGFLLVDSGAQYLTGTTDITRTISLGELTEDMKKYYTAVLRGNLRLASAVFPNGATGANLDILAREPLWKLGKDYNHGTGHGIGYFLNVHEGPQNINWKIGRREGNKVPLAKGMIVSDEPGFYLEGEYGIRTENDVAVIEKEKNGYGTFLGFEVMTLAPIDMTPIVWEDMSKEEIEALNAYHKKVYEKLSPFLDGETAEWLKVHTMPYETI